MVERHLAKVDVAGSSPVSRSIFLRRHSQEAILSAPLHNYLFRLFRGTAGEQGDGEGGVWKIYQLGR